jgi:hypothetical protein
LGSQSSRDPAGEGSLVGYKVGEIVEEIKTESDSKLSNQAPSNGASSGNVADTRQTPDQQAVTNGATTNGATTNAAPNQQVPDRRVPDQQEPTKQTPHWAAFKGYRLHWWVEVLLIAAFYFAYSMIRDIRGEKPVSAQQAFHNALRVVRVERWLHIFGEQSVQQFFLTWHWLAQALDLYYGSLHFVVTAGVLVYLFFKTPNQYRLWRNTLAVTTALALVGFTFFPLMPPRLLPAGQFHFVDTLSVIGGLWSFNSGPMTHLSDQFAAMPSLHTAWSAWSAMALASTFKRRWTKALLVLYPVMTVFCIVVTGNHYFLDAFGGVVILFVGIRVARLLDILRGQRSCVGEAERALAGNRRHTMVSREA